MGPSRGLFVVPSPGSMRRRCNDDRIYRDESFVIGDGSIFLFLQMRIRASFSVGAKSKSVHRESATEDKKKSTDRTLMQNRSDTETRALRQTARVTSLNVVRS